MEISRNVIMDLLPLYFANELSEDSRALVEKHLENDPQLAKLAKQSEAIALSEKIPVPLTQNNELIAYRKAKQVIMWRTIAIAVAIAVFLVLVMSMFFYSSSSSDTSSSTADRLIPLRTPLELALEDLKDRREISCNLCEKAASHIGGHAHSDCIPILQQEDEYMADNCMPRNALTEGMKNV